MKRANNLYHYITNIDNIISMTNKVCKNVKNKEKVDKFESFKSEHIINIKKRLENKNYNFGKYNIFMITDPKCRIVMRQSIEDKIINISIFNKTNDISKLTRVLNNLSKELYKGVYLYKKY